MLCLGIGLGLAATAQAEESATKKSFQFQGNLEAAITNQKVVRTRALPTIIFSRGKYSAEYLGLHEMKNKNSMPALLDKISDIWLENNLIEKKTEPGRFINASFV